MYLIDTHAHIYLPDFDTDRAVLMNNADQAAVKKILMPAIDSSTHAGMLQVENEFDSCVAMMGLHPCSVKENYQEELNIITSYFSNRKFVAVGEIGLDFYWDKTFVAQQYDAFHQQIDIALKNQLPVVIHSRNATDECIDVIAQYPNLHGVFHCFSGSVVQAQKLAALGFMLGIGGVVTFKNAGLDKVVEQIGLSNIILETDAPYLAPVPYRGKRNEPAYISIVAQKVATLTDKDISEVMEITTQNAIKLFNLS